MIISKPIRLLVGAFLLLALPFLASLQAQPEPSGGGKLLFVDTSEPGKTFLATVYPDGSNRQRLTPSYSNLVFPKYSEASGWIGFTNKTPDMKSEVYLLSRDGQKIKKIFQDANFEDFSPDGKSLLYTSCDKQASLYLYSLESKAVQKISDTLKITSASWAPTGNWIVVSAMTDDGTGDLYLISTRAQGFERLTQTPGVDESFPVFSKDGKFLVFISNRYGTPYEVEFLDLENRTFQRPLIQGLYPTLSPSDRWVAYESGPDIAVSQVNGLNQKIATRGRTPTWIK
jgi:Tol biopolymer transport system component